MVELKKYKLNDFLESYGDGLHGTPNYSENGDYYFINGNNLENNRIAINDTTPKLSESEYQKIKRPLKSNALLLSINGTLGKLAFYNNEKIALGKSACYLNIKPEVDRRYIKYVLSTKEFQKYMYTVASGSTIKNFAPKQAADYEFFAPNLPTQKKIADVLSCIDDKIALNNKTNAELENMAKTIYDYWFTQFDFPDKNDRPYKTSGGQMVYNETLKREIPTGWEVKSLIEIESNIVTGKTPSTKDETNFYGDIPFITIDDIRNQLFVCSTERTLSEKGANLQKTKYLPEGSLCCSCIGTAGVIGFVGKKGQTNQQINSIVFSNETNKEFLYYGLNNYFENASGKSGNIFTNMNKDEFGAIQFIYPGKELIRKYHKNVFSIFQKIKENIQENQQLIKLRDYLLPLLMNGQIEVK